VHHKPQHTTTTTQQHNNTTTTTTTTQQQYTTIHNTTTHNTTTHNTTHNIPHHTISHHITPHHITPYHTHHTHHTYHTISHHTTSHHIPPHPTNPTTPHPIRELIVDKMGDEVQTNTNFAPTTNLDCEVVLFKNPPLECSVFVSNIPIFVDEERILEVFSECGLVHDVHKFNPNSLKRKTGI
jgi:hypothetical protein